MDAGIPPIYQKEGTVLIVDDNRVNLNLLYEYLTHSGYEVLLAQDGEDALDQAIHLGPDIILLDIMMPGIDGFETCQRLKTHDATKEIPIIFITALTNTKDKIKGFQLGGVDYMTKPFQPEEVGVRVHTHLLLRKMQAQLRAQNELLQRQTEELTQLNASKDKFFSIIAHDLRTPLTVFLANTRTAAEYLDKLTHAELHTMIEDLRTTSENLYTLLENLLQWSQLQRGLVVYNLQKLDLSAILHRNITLLQPNADQKQIRLNNLIHDGLHVYADEHVVDLVLRNLLSNAVKFTPAHGQITITAHIRAQHITIAVADNGVGIAEEDLPKLFRFDQRYHGRGTAGEGGAGLGLILCKELLEAIGGHLNVSSMVGKGSTFSLILSKYQET